MANTWILIRHPDKEGDKEGVYLGDTARITKKGERQMTQVIRRLKQLNPDVVTCSLFPRAVALAEHVAQELGIGSYFQHGFFNEIDKPRFLIGMKRTDPEHVRVMQAIRDQFDADTVPTELLRGEKIRTRSELEREIALTFRFIETFAVDPKLPPAQTVLTVTHAKRIAAIVQYLIMDGSLLGYYRMADRVFKIGTTGITILSYEPDRRTHELGWVIRTLNEEVHMDETSLDELESLIQTLDTSPAST